MQYASEQSTFRGRPMSDVMFSCMDFMRENHGAIYRQPGGFWTDSATYRPSQRTFNASTVQGLVRRGVAEYVDWKDGRRGRFPIKARLVRQE